MDGKFLITGPECSGKSSIASWASDYWGGICVPEYARIHLHTLNRPYEFEDLLVIANQQLLLEKLAERKRKPIFCDTSLLVIHIWMMEKYGKSLWNQGFDMYHLHEYDHVYLCVPDMPWEQDAYRENPMDRGRLYTLYESHLESYGITFTRLSGLPSKRNRILLNSLAHKN